MRRLVILSAFFLAVSVAPSVAADCYWSNGVYKCTDRSGRTYVVRPRAEPNRQYRPSEGYVRPSPSYPPSGGGMGSFTYGCTMSRCD